MRIRVSWAGFRAEDPVGMLAEMLAAGMNANLGGRDHMAIEVERQLVTWTRDLFGFPRSATGLFVTGTSAANFMGVLVARTRALGSSVRARGLAEMGRHLTAYASEAAHGCIIRAMEMAGLGETSFDWFRWTANIGSRSPPSGEQSPKIVRMVCSRSCDWHGGNR